MPAIQQRPMVLRPGTMLCRCLEHEPLSHCLMAAPWAGICSEKIAVVVLQCFAGSCSPSCTVILPRRTACSACGCHSNRAATAIGLRACTPAPAASPACQSNFFMLTHRPWRYAEPTRLPSPTNSAGAAAFTAFAARAASPPAEPASPAATAARPLWCEHRMFATLHAVLSFVRRLCVEAGLSKAMCSVAWLDWAVGISLTHSMFKTRHAPLGLRPPQGALLHDTSHSELCDTFGALQRYTLMGCSATRSGGQQQRLRDAAKLERLVQPPVHVRLRPRVQRAGVRGQRAPRRLRLHVLHLLHLPGACRSSWRLYNGLV